MLLPPVPLCLLDKLGARRIETLIKDSEARQSPDEPGLCCRQCGAPITNPACRIERGGAHVHHLTNPHGFQFTIGCFSDAPGCLAEGAASTDYSWFIGYAWRIVLCAGCGQHLGWRFEGRNPIFFGLILAQLVECGPHPH